MNAWTPEHEAAFSHALSRADTIKGRLQRACLLLLAEHSAEGMLPTSGRFLFYELVSRGVIEKHRLNVDGAASTRRSDTDVSDALTVLRKSGLIPWGWIVDETREVEEWAHASTVGDYLIGSLDHARLDVWGGETPPLIITESRSLAGVLRSTASEFLASITALNGQASGSLLANEIAPLLAGQPVLFLGDLDVSGGHIEESVKKRLGGEHDWMRLAITSEQVAAYGLVGVPKTDKRTKKTTESWETESLSQSVIVALVRDALTDLRDERGLEPLDDVQERAAEERERLRRLLPALAHREAETLLAPLLD